MKKIVLLSTGGTIASVPSDDGRGIAGSLPGEALTKHIQLNPEIELRVSSVFQKPSNSLSFADLCKLQTRCQELIDSGTADGIVITHGTDMLEDTAYFLETTLELKNVPVIVTGAQRVPYAQGTDSYTNLQDAIHAAAHPSCQDCGVLVLFNQTLFSAGFVRKTSSYQLNGFDSPGYGFLGLVDNNQPHIYQKPVRLPVFRLAPNTNTLPDVHIVSVYLGAQSTMLKACIESDAAGIVIDGVGRGQLPPTWVELIRKAVAQGKQILICTSTLHGPVHQSYAYPGALQESEAAGAIGVSGLPARKARIRLAVLLSQNVTDATAIRQAFSA